MKVKKERRMVDCPRCLGEGVIPMRAGGYDWCPECGGKKKIFQGTVTFSIGENVGQLKTE